MWVRARGGFLGSTEKALPLQKDRDLLVMSEVAGDFQAACTFLLGGTLGERGFGFGNSAGTPDSFSDPGNPSG